MAEVPHMVVSQGTVQQYPAQLYSGDDCPVRGIEVVLDLAAI
jgi:hypothetical protein